MELHRGYSNMVNKPTCCVFCSGKARVYSTCKIKKLNYRDYPETARLGRHIFLIKEKEIKKGGFHLPFSL